MTTQAETPAGLASGERVSVPKQHAVEGFIELSSKADGISLRDLEPLTALDVHTKHSVYHITVLEPHRREILIQGGRLLPLTARARLLGSSFGRGLLKVGTVTLGMRMEFMTDGRRIVTSPVGRVAIGNDPAIAGPF